MLNLGLAICSPVTLENRQVSGVPSFVKDYGTILFYPLYLTKSLADPRSAPGVAHLHGDILPK